MREPTIEMTTQQNQTFNLVYRGSISSHCVCVSMSANGAALLWPHNPSQWWQGHRCCSSAAGCMGHWQPAILWLTGPTRWSAHHLSISIGHSTGSSAAAEVTSSGPTTEQDWAHLGFALMVTNRKTATAESLTVCIMLVVCFHPMQCAKQTPGSGFRGRAD